MNAWVERLYRVITSPEYREAEKEIAMSSPDPLRDYEDGEQWNDKQERQFLLLKALQKVHRAGLEDEALLLAFEGGVLDEFKRGLNG